jgi:hypothetical protein
MRTLVRHGVARHGTAGLARPGSVRRGMTWSGTAGLARLRRSEAWHGTAGRWVASALAFPFSAPHRHDVRALDRLAPAALQRQRVQRGHVAAMGLVLSARQIRREQL